MLALLLHNRNAWDDYFPVTNPNYYTTRQTPSDKHVYVSNSLFDSIIYQKVTMGVRCHAHQRHIFLLSLLLSSHVRQAVVKEELFTSPIVVANVLFIVYVVMIVARHTQVVFQVVSLRI